MMPPTRALPEPAVSKSESASLSPSPPRNLFKDFFENKPIVHETPTFLEYADSDSAHTTSNAENDGTDATIESTARMPISSPKPKINSPIQKHHARAF